MELYCFFRLFIEVTFNGKMRKHVAQLTKQCGQTTKLVEMTDNN